MPNGKKAAETLKKKFGPDYYAKLGSKGGSAVKKEHRPFHLDPALASRAGKLSKRGKSVRRKGSTN